MGKASKKAWAGVLKLGAFTFKPPKVSSEGVNVGQATCALKVVHESKNVSQLVEFLMANGSHGLQIKFTEEEGGEEWLGYGHVPNWSFKPRAGDEDNDNVEIALDALSEGGNCSKLEALAKLRIGMATDGLHDVTVSLKPHQLDLVTHEQEDGGDDDVPGTPDRKSQAAGEKADRS